MKINKDDELLATPEEFMIIDKIRKDQRAEFVKDLEGLRHNDPTTTLDPMIQTLITKHQK